MFWWNTTSVHLENWPIFFCSNRNIDLNDYSLIFVYLNKKSVSVIRSSFSWTKCPVKNLQLHQMIRWSQRACFFFFLFFANQKTFSTASFGPGRTFRRTKWPAVCLHRMIPQSKRLDDDHLFKPKIHFVQVSSTSLCSNKNFKWLNWSVDLLFLFLLLEQNPNDQPIFY